MQSQTHAPHPDIFVILNRHSGKGEEKPSSEEISAAFERHGKQVEVLEVSAGEDIQTKVSEVVGNGPTCVVAAGGDGTIYAVADALKGTGIALGILPFGTFNYFARRFDIPTDLAGAVEVICSGVAAPIDLGTINGKVFVNNASVGLYASILKERESVYRRWGRSRLAAYWSVLVAMATVYRPITMQISVDGKVERAQSPMVFVATSAYQLDEFGIEGGDAIRDGKFAMLLAPDCGRFMLIWKALLIASRGAREGRDFTLLTGESLTVETRRATRLVAIDGERERMSSPYRFEIHRAALIVLMPSAAPEAKAA